MTPYELQLALRDLARHPRHTLGMMLGLALAVLVMIYIPSTMSSFYSDMIDRTIEQNSAHVTVWPAEKQRGQMERTLDAHSPQGLVADLADFTMPRKHNLNGRHALALEVGQTPGVAAVAAFAKGDATISRGNVNLGIQVEGIAPEEYAQVVNIGMHFEGRHVPALGPSDIAVGFRMADKLALHVGEHVNVLAPGTRRLFKVKAIFRSGYYEKDLHHAYVLLPSAQRMFNMGNEVSGLAVRCAELNEAGLVSSALDARLSHTLRNWKDDNASLLAEVATVKRVTFFINVLVALVAAAGMGNVFSIFVLNRQKELAILRAMGSSRNSLRAILLLEAFFIWVCGTFAGCLGALAVMAYEQSHPYAVSAETYGIGSYATKPQMAAFVMACGLAAATMAVSALWSGRKASSLNPAAVIFGR